MPQLCMYHVLMCNRHTLNIGCDAQQTVLFTPWVKTEISWSANVTILGPTLLCLLSSKLIIQLYCLAYLLPSWVQRLWYMYMLLSSYNSVLHVTKIEQTVNPFVILHSKWLPRNPTDEMVYDLDQAQQRETSAAAIRLSLLIFRATPSL